MEDRNKDLPLIVSEILIEMHEMKGDIREMKEALNRMAATMLKQQEHTNNVLGTFQQESQKNMEYTTSLLTEFRRESQEDREFARYSFNKMAGKQQQVNAAFEQRLTQLEAKYNG